MTDWLRVGGSVGYGVASIYSKSVVSAMGGSFQDQEVITEINAHSWFIPKAVASVVLSPWQQVELFGVLTYHGDMNAKGTADLTANGVNGRTAQELPRRESRHALPHRRRRGQRAFPHLRGGGGVRFAKLRRNREGVLNPMRDEVFDLELRGHLESDQQRRPFRRQAAQPGGGRRLDHAAHPVEQPRGRRRRLVHPPEQRHPQVLEGHVLSFRAGGDMQLVPEHLTVRGGAVVLDDAASIPDT